MFGKDQDAEFQDEVCKIAVNNYEDYDWDYIECGIPEVLCNQILVQSGVVDNDTIRGYIEQDRYDIECDAEIQMISFIQHIYPQYTDEYLDSISSRELIKLYARSLYVLKFQEEERTVYNLNKVFEEKQRAEAQQKQLIDARKVLKNKVAGLGSNNIYGTGQ